MRVCSFHAADTAGREARMSKEYSHLVPKLVSVHLLLQLLAEPRAEVGALAVDDADALRFHALARRLVGNDPSRLGAAHHGHLNHLLQHAKDGHSSLI